ncbi:hypothetical protein D3C75_1275130 [compost metagenome]
MIYYKLFHRKTGAWLGSVSSKESLTEALYDLFFDDGIYSSDVRIEEIYYPA